MRSASLVLVVAVLFNAAMPAAARDVTVRWSELAPHVVDKKVTVILANGHTVGGRVAQVRPEELVFKAGKTVARTSIEQIRMRKNYIWGRLIGAGAGAVLGATLHANEPNKPGEPSAGATALVTAGVGFLIGYGADLIARFALTTHIHIAPDVAPDNLTTNFEQ
jgi:hypothetical protein